MTATFQGADLTLPEAVDRLRDLTDALHGYATPTGIAYFITPEEWEAIAYAKAILGLFVEALEDVR